MECMECLQCEEISKDGPCDARTRTYEENVLHKLKQTAERKKKESLMRGIYDAKMSFEKSQSFTDEDKENILIETAYIKGHLSGAMHERNKSRY